MTSYSDLDENDTNTTMVPEAHCPVCESKLDAAHPTAGAPAPMPGDVSICFYCTAFLVFNDDMLPESIGDEEFETLEPEVKAELERVRSVIQKMKSRTKH